MERISLYESYKTPSSQKRHWLDILSLGTRAYFILSFIKIVIRTAKIASKGIYTREKWIRSSHDIFRLIERCGGKFDIQGLENLRGVKGPVVLVGNHMSTLETMILPGLIAPEMETTFVVKDSLVKHPFFGSIMRSRNPIVVSRENSREDLVKVLEEGSKILEQGISIIIFPQSTRDEVFHTSQFNTLGVKLASKAGVPVIPIALKTDFWKNGKSFMKDLGPIRRKKTIYFSFGKVIKIQGSGKEEQKMIVDFIQSNLKSWGAIISQ